MGRKKKIDKTPLRRKSQQGKGRPVATSSCKRKVKCQVPGCDRYCRTDNIKRHYQNTVVFKSDGTPIEKTHPKFRELSKSKQDHTVFFSFKWVYIKSFATNRGRTCLYQSFSAC